VYEKRLGFECMMVFIFSKFKRYRPSPRSLYFAAKQGNELQVLLVAAGCNVNATIPQEKHKTAMHAAAGAGHARVLRLLCMVSGECYVDCYMTCLISARRCLNLSSVRTIQFDQTLHFYFPQEVMFIRVCVSSKYQMY
jgi:hypothetical protein